MKELSARTIAGIVVEIEICNYRLIRLRSAVNALPADDHAAAQRLLKRVTEVNKIKRALILDLQYYSVDQQIAEAFNPGQPFVTEAADLLRGA